MFTPNYQHPHPPGYTRARPGRLACAPLVARDGLEVIPALLGVRMDRSIGLLERRLPLTLARGVRHLLAATPVVPARGGGGPPRALVDVFVLHHAALGFNDGVEDLHVSVDVVVDLLQRRVQRLHARDRRLELRRRAGLELLRLVVGPVVAARDRSVSVDLEGERRDLYIPMVKTS